MGPRLAVLACGNAIPCFLADSAVAFDLATSATSAKGSERILVVLELDGGNDGLNTIVPYNDDIYRKSRPKLQVPAGDVLRIDDAVGFHPNLPALAEGLSMIAQLIKAELKTQRQVLPEQFVGLPILQS